MRIDESCKQLLEGEQECLLLGIITGDGTVLLRRSSPRSCPGHGEWLRQEPDIDAVHGFSVSVKHGVVTEVYRASAVNPEEQNALLDAGVLEQLMTVLPVADDVVVYGH